MSKVAGTHPRMVAYLPSLRTVLQRLRATTSTPSTLHPTLFTPTVTTATSTTTPTPFADAFYNPDLVAARLHPQLPFPGAVGMAPPPPPIHTSTTPTLPEPMEKGPLVAITEKDDQGAVECMVQECPQLLRRGFLQLFPDSPLTVKSGEMTVVTMSERTVHDMTSWSQEVEQEREELLDHFINSAKEICQRLTGAGYWADFIDPASGRPYYGSYVTETLFETDERFVHLGFDILDLGCCKCINHPLWGSHTFIGAIFTNAPTNSPSIRSVLEL